MQAFCPKCGTETEGLGPRGLCTDCYTEEEELLETPDTIDVTLCSICGSVKVGPNWVEVEDDREMIYEVLDHHIPGENVVAVGYDKDEDSGNYDIKILVEQMVDGEPLQQEVETTLAVEKDQCELCAKFHGGYYTYVIQIRSEHDDVSEDVLQPLMDRAAEITDRDREHFLADAQRNEHGYDLYLSTRHIAEQLLKELEDHYEVTKQRSKELVGQEEGQEVYRTVISARIIGDK